MKWQRILWTIVALAVAGGVFAYLWSRRKVSASVGIMPGFVNGQTEVDPNDPERVIYRDTMPRRTYSATEYGELADIGDTL